ncbi:MAG: tryptophan synthase subunit alpha, partial [bacterium]|nr:tryptophan synthase subunit alpha [bacterium]
QTKLPIVIGFGISSPEQAKKMAALADGAVVGSHFVKQAQIGSVKKIQRLAQQYRKELS